MTIGSEQLSRLAALLQSRDRYLILTHRRPDGDAVGSAAALCRILHRLGKVAYVCANPETPDKLLPFVADFLPPADFVPETVVAVDVASWSQLGVGMEGYEGKVDILMDHHQDNTMEIRCAKVSDVTAAAVGELMWALSEALGQRMDRETATAVYLSVSTDTGCFLYSNTTADTHRVAAACIEAGIDLAWINMEFFERRSRARIHMEQLVYANLRYLCGGRAVVMLVTQQMRRETGVTEDDISDLSSLPRKIEGVELGLAVYEQPDGSTKISVRTAEQVDAAALCRRFGGGGHVRAAGCSLPDAPEQAIERMMAAVQEIL